MDIVIVCFIIIALLSIILLFVSAMSYNKIQALTAKSTYYKTKLESEIELKNTYMEISEASTTRIEQLKKQLEDKNNE